jgi:hypothetical protein
MKHYTISYELVNTVWYQFVYHSYVNFLPVYEHGNEPLRYTQGEEIFDQVRD